MASPAPDACLGAPAHLPGFTRGERAFMAIAAGVIAVWGLRGVDFEAARRTLPDVPEPAAGAAAGSAESGRQVFEANGCPACHAPEGPPGIGPDLRGIWGTRQPLEDGSSVLVDRIYFQESVLHPEARLVRGYPPSMPSYEGLIGPDALLALEEYVRSLR